MIPRLVFSAFLIFCTALPVQSLDENAPCRTPNNEEGRCLVVTQCAHIKNGIYAMRADIIEFARKSFCGGTFKTGFRVCCASTGVLALPAVYQHPLLPDSSICGLEPLNSRVYGGVETKLGEFPWMALLKYIEEGITDFHCGGTLISKRYVLTAAHCTRIPASLDKKLVGVRLGEHNTRTNPDCTGRRDNPNLQTCAEPVLDVEIEETINYPNFTKGLQTHDISLIRLKRDVSFTKYIHPICLSSGGLALPVGTSLILAGWGETELSSAISEVKLKVVLPVTNSAQCGLKLRTQISENQFCAGAEQDKDTCKGDSGGPAMRSIPKSDPQQWIQEGIVSYGHTDCAILGQSGVYTKVSAHLDWIVNNMRE